MENELQPRLRDLKTGAEHALTGRIVTAGSSADSRIRIEGRKTAPHAAHFMFSRGGYVLQAVSPHGRILVNGEQVGSDGRRLSHGDTIVIEGQGFRYAEHPEQAKGGKKPDPVSPVEDLIHIVVSLLKNRSEDVCEGLVTSVSRLLHCDAARLVVENTDDGTRQTIARYPATAGLERFSSRAIDWAREASRSVLMHESDWSEETGPMHSLEQNLVASVLCAPLREGDRVLGYLYLDRLQTSGPFTEQDRSFCDTLVPLFSTIVTDAERHRRQRDTIARLQENKMTGAGAMVYESEVMRELVARARTFASAESPLLILGETGTGKELIARFIHEKSSRAGRQFTAINCGAIPENLMESELFGHEKGAFTGATQRKTGLFEAATGGTVFLDEAGELPSQLQVKLLRVLQESEIVRIGGNDTIKVDVRVLAATNRELETEVAEGRFRQDLFFRLNVLSLTLPPLRQRGSDIALLAEYFVKKYCDQFGLPLKTLSAESRSLLCAHAWPGNIRELENVIQKTILLSAGSTIRGADIQLTSSDLFAAKSGQIVTTLRDARNRAEKNIIIQALSRSRGNVSMSAKILDIDRKWLMKKMDELEIDADSFRR